LEATLLSKWRGKTYFAKKGNVTNIILKIYESTGSKCSKSGVKNFSSPWEAKACCPIVSKKM
jgi:hypothetical protein